MENFNIANSNVLCGDFIEDIANMVRQTLELRQAPYDPEMVVKVLGGKIVRNIEGDGIDACIKKDGDEGFVIDMNKIKYAKRDVFTIAHELGHLFLHMGFLWDDNLWKNKKEFEDLDAAYYRKSGTDEYSRKHIQMEYEANAFAANFLMPKDEFIAVAVKIGTPNIGQIANHFGVSAKAAQMRGKWLGVFEW